MYEKSMMKIQHISEDVVAHLIMVAMSNILNTIIPLYTPNYVACGGQLHHLRASFEQLELFDVPQWPFAQFKWLRSHGSLKAAWQSSACWWWTLLTVCLFTLTACWSSSVDGSDVLLGSQLKHKWLKKVFISFLPFLGPQYCWSHLPCPVLFIFVSQKKQAYVQVFWKKLSFLSQHSVEEKKNQQQP